MAGVGISFVKNIMAPTRAGTKLAMDIHVKPTVRKARGPWIFTYIPYRRLRSPNPFHH